MDSRERAKIGDRQLGFIFHSFNLIADLTVCQSAELPLTNRGMRVAERSEHVHRALKRVGTGHRIKHYPSQLSGGPQQSVALARALAGDPEILLANDPTGNLDSKNRDAMMNLLIENPVNGLASAMFGGSHRMLNHLFAVQRSCMPV